MPRRFSFNVLMISMVCRSTWKSKRNDRPFYGMVTQPLLCMYTIFAIHLNNKLLPPYHYDETNRPCFFSCWHQEFCSDAVSESSRRFFGSAEGSQIRRQLGFGQFLWYRSDGIGRLLWKHSRCTRHIQGGRISSRYVISGQLVLRT